MEWRLLATNLRGVIGCDYLVSQKQLIFVEWIGNISSIDTSSQSLNHQVLGTDYEYLEDIIVSADEEYAFVTERGGNLIRVELKNPDRANAYVVSSDINKPQQIALDESQGFAYVVEFAEPGRFLRVDLNSGKLTPLVGDLQWAIGLLLTSDSRFAYISEQTNDKGGQLSCIEMSTGQRRVLISGLSDPFFLTWADNDQNAILATERDPANRVLLVDLKQQTVSHLAVGVPRRPSSVAVMTPDRLLLCCDEVICELNAPST
jgi:DNA-binding beta-propeller fold protein YncE